MMKQPNNESSPEVDMKPQQMVKPALIAGAVLVALVIAGLPATYLGFLVLIVACPLMMYFMMRGMAQSGGNESHADDQHATNSRGEGPSTTGH